MSDFEHQVNWETGASGESRSDYHEHSGEQQIPDNFIGDGAVYALRKVAGDLRAPGFYRYDNVLLNLCALWHLIVSEYGRFFENHALIYYYLFNFV